MSAIGTKRTSPHCTCPLSGARADKLSFACTCLLMTQSGHERAFPSCRFKPVRCRVLSLGGRNEAARVHHASRWRGSGVAARGACAAAPSGCGASACSCPSPRTIRKIRPASRRFCRGCSNWAGPTAATCGSTLAGPQAMPIDIRKYAAELVALAPDVILATGSLDRGAVATGDPHRADRVCDRRRSGRRRLRR